MMRWVKQGHHPTRFDAGRHLTGLYKTMREQSIKPTPGGDLFGELRSLISAPWTGGERWSDWGPFFDAHSAHEQQRAVDYLQDHWTTAEIRCVEDVADHLTFCAIETCKGAFEATGLWSCEAPVSHEEVRQWEAEYGRLPNEMVRFLTRFSAGDPIPDDGEVHFYMGPADYDLPLFLTFGMLCEYNLNEHLWYEEDVDQCLQDLDAVLAFDASQESKLWDMRELAALPRPTRSIIEDIKSALVVYIQYENAGMDQALLAIRRGPFAGHMVAVEDIFFYELQRYNILTKPVQVHRTHSKSTLQLWLEQTMMTHYLGIF